MVIRLERTVIVLVWWNETKSEADAKFKVAETDRQTHNWQHVCNNTFIVRYQRRTEPPLCKPEWKIHERAIVSYSTHRGGAWMIHTAGSETHLQQTGTLTGSIRFKPWETDGCERAEKGQSSSNGTMLLKKLRFHSNFKGESWQRMRRTQWRTERRVQ